MRASAWASGRLALAGAVAVAIAACDPSSAKSGATGDATATATTAATAATGAMTSASAFPSPSAEPPRAERARVKVVEATQDSDALSLVRTKRLEAKADGRVLVVYVSATWCEPCKKLKSELESGRLDDRLAKVTLLAFDADRDGDRLGAAGYSYRFVPYVALPGADGRPADSQQATGKGGDAWRELLGKLDAWQARAP